MNRWDRMRTTCICLVLLTQPVCAEESFLRVSELMKKVASEREKLIQYSVDVVVKGRLPSAETTF